MNIKILLFGFLVLFSILFSCKNKKRENGPPNNSIEAADSNTISENKIEPVVNLSPVWILDISDAGKNKMKKLREPDSVSLTIQNLVAVLNAHYEKVQCVFDHRSNDTIYIRIPDSEHLTQRMGSSGGEAYMAEAVYTLTEIGGVKYIRFDFEEGDHAIPGTYRRKDFDY